MTINSKLTTGPWLAQWIAVDGAPVNEYNVYHFRKTIDLAGKPAKSIVHVSADKRTFSNSKTVGCIASTGC